MRDDKSSSSPSLNIIAFLVEFYVVTGRSFAHHVTKDIYINF